MEKRQYNLSDFDIDIENAKEIFQQKQYMPDCKSYLITL